MCDTSCTLSPCQGATHVLVLRVGARLLVKLAMKLGMPVRSEHEYSIFHRTSIATVRSSQPLTPRHSHATTHSHDHS